MSEELLVSIRGLKKSFGPTRALVDGSFEMRRGEVHALVGENGSGKSTLVKILSGVHAPDAGEITLAGRTITSLESPRRAQRAGIATVFQEVLAVEPRSVLDNLWLGADSVFVAAMSRDKKRAKAEALLAELMEDPPSLDTVIEDLGLSDRQVCSIARAILKEPTLLILDEATSALDFGARERLFRVVRRLAEGGTGVVLITHKMDEIEDIGDRITVLRSGSTVATLERGDWDTATLVRLMTGSDSLTAEARERSDRPLRDASSPVVLEARALQLATGSAPIDVTIRRGEFVGLAGLEGHGQDAFLKALWGMRVVSGEVVRPDAGGADITITSPRKAAAQRIAYLARDRRNESIFEQLSILDNFSLPTISRDVRGGFIRNSSSRTRLDVYRDRLRIKLGRYSDEIRTLSGGNQQKVVLARWLALNPEILLLNDPTRGIDINAKRDLYGFLEELAHEGTTVVMLSTEVDEHVELMDRVLVFREQTVVDEIARVDLSRERLVGSYFGAQGVDA